MLAKLPVYFWVLVAFFVALGILASSFLQSRKGRQEGEPNDPWRNEPESEPFTDWAKRMESAPKTPPVDTSRWTLELLRALEWHRFELLCAAYFETLGFRAETTKFGADGGIDVLLYQGHSVQPVMIVQCKAWNSGPVGVSIVRELYGVMARKKISEGILLTTGTFTPEARAFPEADELHLWEGTEFLSKIQALTGEQQRALLAKAVQGDFTTPTCPSCGIKLVWRVPKGKGRPFWGCTNFPKCRQTMHVQGFTT